MAEFGQPSFSAGEIAPAAFGRVDLAKYATALKTCRNFLTRVHGGVVNRPGTEFIAESSPGRFIPFIFNENQAYVLDFKDSRMSVISNGGYVLEPNKAATLNPSPQVVFTVPGHGYNNGDYVFVTNTGILDIDDQFWQVFNAFPDTFQLADCSAASSGGFGTVARMFTTPSPYPKALLPRVSFAQLRDVMTIAIAEIKPQNLSRLDHANWVFNDTAHEEGPFQELNSDNTKTMNVSATVGGITISTNFAAFTSLNVGQLVYIEQLNRGAPWEVGREVVVGDVYVSIGKYYKALDAGPTGTVRPIGEKLGENENDGKIRWEYVHSGYGVARITSVIDGAHATATVLLAMPDELISVDSYKWAMGAWGGDQGWPAVVTYYQQRRTFFSTPVKPEYVWMSGTNAYTYFGKSTPIVDDDAVTMQLVSKQVSPARFAIDLGKLIVLTPTGKWVIPDDDNNPTITPTRRSARPQGALGASNVLPATVEDSIIYIVEKGQTVQDIAFQFVSNAYSGKDLSVLSKHLFEKHNIVAAAYQHVPFQVYWLVRDDGLLIGCTYLREHEVWGWHRHDYVNGFVEDVCVIPEGQEDRVYLKIRRIIQGVARWYTERLTSRLFTDIRDAHFVDCGLKYDGRNTTNITMTIVPVPGGGGFGGGGFGGGGFGGGGFGGGVVEGRLHASVPYFDGNKHLGDEIHFPYEDKVIKAKLVGFIDVQTAVIEVRMTIPTPLLNTPTTSWGHAKYKLIGMKHLEGQRVSVLADGKVHPQLNVTNARVTLQYAAVVIIAGLPIEADFETLNLNAPAPGSILDREKCLFAVRMIVEESRGIFAGPDADHLDEFVQRESEPYEEPVALKTGLASIRVDSHWEPGGRVFVRQVDPLPLSILNIMPDVDVGGAR